MLNALALIFGIVIGFLSAYILFSRKCKGSLQIYRTDINEDDSMFLQLNEQVNAIKNKSFVTLKIVYRDLLDDPHN